ncbi:putative immunity protein [Streptomyces decoyicus]|uniref:putative immunity protein n=1 Tax=Streptomyces decoyicus TaxID=249567 RepID=UPI00363FCA3C
MTVDCSRRALSICEQSLPADTLPRDAMDAVHAFAGGGRPPRALRQGTWAAYKAAQEDDPSAAGDASRAASQEDGAALLRPLASAHQVNTSRCGGACGRAEELAFGVEQPVNAGGVTVSSNEPIEDREQVAKAASSTLHAGPQARGSAVAGPSGVVGADGRGP